jgi:hypothetical protein
MWFAVDKGESIKYSPVEENLMGSARTAHRFLDSSDCQRYHGHFRGHLPRFVGRRNGWKSKTVSQEAFWELAQNLYKAISGG